MKREINNNIDITKKYSDDNYVDFRDLRKLPYIRLLRETEDIKSKIESLYLCYRNIFVDALPRMERPVLTPVFIGRKHYTSAFKLIQRVWNVKFDFQGDMLLFNIQKMSYLYEMYNFFFLLDVIDEKLRGFDFMEDNNNENNCAKYFRSYRKNELVINFYYEPSYFCRKQSSLNLIRISSKEGSYYKPDFLLEFISPYRENVYCILDAKYSRQETVRKRLNDCIYKYILNTGIYQNPHKKIDYLFALAPIDKEVDCVISESYFPQIGVLSSKPSNTGCVKNIISKIVKSVYGDLLE